MATHPSTAPASAGERSCSPSPPYAAIPDFSQPVPLRRPVVLTPRCGVSGDRRPPVEPQKGENEAHQVSELSQTGDAPVQAHRLLDLAGELLTASAIIAGGVFAYGFMPFA